MAADRHAYGALQAQLLETLLGGGEPPAGFAAAQAHAAGRALRRQRAHAVRKAWPALASALGERFDERFDAFSQTQDPPQFGHGLTDGLAFASSPFSDDALDDDVHVEVLLARAMVARRRRRPDTHWAARRGVFVGALWLADPYRRLLVVIRLPALGRFALTTRRRARSGP